jgi:hypothetical protein
MQLITAKHADEQHQGRTDEHYYSILQILGAVSGISAND